MSDGKLLSSRNSEYQTGNNVGKRFRFLCAASVPPHLFPEHENGAGTRVVYEMPGAHQLPAESGN